MLFIFINIYVTSLGITCDFNFDTKMGGMASFSTKKMQQWHMSRVAQCTLANMLFEALLGGCLKCGYDVAGNHKRGNQDHILK